MPVQPIRTLSFSDLPASDATLWLYTKAVWRASRNAAIAATNWFGEDELFGLPYVSPAQRFPGRVASSSQARGRSRGEVPVDDVA